MLESRIFGPDEDSSRDSGKKNRTHAASLTVRARWGRIRSATRRRRRSTSGTCSTRTSACRSASPDLLPRLAFGAVCFVNMNGAFGGLGNDYLEVPHSAAAQCRRRGRPRAPARARAALVHKHHY